MIFKEKCQLHYQLFCDNLFDILKNLRSKTKEKLMFAKSVERFQTQNHERKLGSSLYSFVNSLIWFMDVAEPVEKLGVIRMLLCNMNFMDDFSKKQKIKIDAMIDTIQLLIDEQREKPFKEEKVDTIETGRY